MTRLGLTVLVCLCAFLILYNGDGVSATGCGCSYNIHANKDEAQRASEACSVSCIYSTLSGRCNNIQNPEWGEHDRPFRRLLNPDYCTAIGADATRCDKSNNPLPSARKLSVELNQDQPTLLLDKFLTIGHMAFGQFLSHDFGRKQPSEPNDASGNDHCGPTQCNVNAVCTPIQVLTGDPDFTPSPAMCLRFHRSKMFNSPYHGLKEQKNDVSSYMDFSTVYGGTAAEISMLRDVRPGFTAYLNMTRFSQIDLGPGVKEGKPLLPQLGGGDCRGQTAAVKCFLAGDTRVQEQPQLTVFHTIFAREHNRIVDALDHANAGCWSQDRLFLEARKINNAVWQYIVYNEYLPLLFSDATRTKWNLKLQSSGFTNAYDASVDATTTNVFMTASFRSSHTQITKECPLRKNDFSSIRNELFSGFFRNPSLIYDVGDAGITAVDAIAFGLFGSPAEATDDFLNKQITRSFDAPSVNALGRDLLAIDFQRGRDHGLPGYNDWLAFCGYDKATTFNDFKFIKGPLRNKLAALYGHVDDVDLFVAGVLETPETGDLMGPIFTCLNAEQFKRTRFGDRFWHEEEPNGFTTAQLQNIRQQTLARVFCDNLDHPVSIQPYVLVKPKSENRPQTQSSWNTNLVYNQKLGSNNERVLCTSITGLDYSLWKELPTGCCPTS